MRSTITTAVAVLLVAVSRTRAAHLPDLGAGGGGGACVGPCSAGSGGTIGKDVVHAELNLDSLCFTVQWDNNFTAAAALMDEEKEDCIFRGIFVDDDDSDVTDNSDFEEESETSKIESDTELSLISSCNDKVIT